MRLSEAIRLGSMMKPQGRGGHSMVSKEATCALGAAGDAIGLDGIRWCPLALAFPILDFVVTYPGVKAGPGVAPGCNARVMTCIWALNDVDHWTRERIAGWVATIEARHESAVAPNAEARDSQPVTGSPICA